MKAKALGLFLIYSLLFTVFAQAESASIGDFALLDHRGQFHQLSHYANRDAVVVFIQGNACPISRQASATLTTLQQSFAANKIEFLMLNANDARDSVIEEATEYGINFPILIDEAQLVAESMGAQTTGEVFVIDPKASRIVYRGPISASVDGKEMHYLEDVLSSLSTGQVANFNPPAVAGTQLRFPKRRQHQRTAPSYQNDIVPILQERCIACHQEDGLAPWAMNSHQMVRGWAPMIRETVMTKRMPPGQIDNVNLDRFKEVHHITPDEQATLVHWIDAGAPMQGDKDPLTSLITKAPEWTLGKPDLIVDVPAQDVPATGVIDYRYIPVDIGLTESKWVRAYEYSIGEKAVLHHIIAFTEDTAKPGARQLMGGYGPGKPPTQLPEDAGFLLTPTTRFVMQIHYTTNGRAAVDNTKMALYFADETPKYHIRNDNAINPRFVIPPQVQDYPISATFNVPKDSYLYSFSPHMHFRGKRMDYTVVYPDGRSELLINIPNYRFDWQMDYKLKEPLFLPKDTKIVANGAFDNSEMNQFNPDPNQEVRWGDQTWEEMFIGFVGIAYAEGGE